MSDNLKEKVNRIKKWNEGEESGPFTLEINPTNRCNLECRFCWQRGTEPDLSKELDDEKLLSIIDEASEIGVQEVRIPGSGEPFIRKDILFRMMKRIKEEGMHGLVITNGTLLDEEILEELVELRWDNLTISIDGPDANTHDYLRNRSGTFEKVRKNLNTLKEIKERKGSKKPKLRFNSVLADKNYEKLPEIIEFANQFGCEDVQLQPITPFSGIGDQCKYNGSEEKLKKYLKGAVKIANRYDIFTNMDTFVDNEIVERTDEMDEVIREETEGVDNPFLSAPCLEPWYNMVILPQGKTAQCSMFGGKGGVQIKGKTLEEVWYSDYFNNARKRILNHDLFSYCENCCVPVNLENKKIRNKLKKRLQ